MERIHISEEWEFNYERLQRFGVGEEFIESNSTSKQINIERNDYKVIDFVMLNNFLWRHFLQESLETRHHATHTRMDESIHRNYRLYSNIKSSFHT